MIDVTSNRKTQEVKEQNKSAPQERTSKRHGYEAENNRKTEEQNRTLKKKEERELKREEAQDLKTKKPKRESKRRTSRWNLWIRKSMN